MWYLQSVYQSVNAKSNQNHSLLKHMSNTFINKMQFEIGITRKSKNVTFSNPYDSDIFISFTLIFIHQKHANN